MCRFEHLRPRPKAHSARGNSIRRNIARRNTTDSGSVVTRAFKVGSDGLLDLIIDGEVVATLPFDNYSKASAFGTEFVERDEHRQEAIARHPAGKRLTG